MITIANCDGDDRDLIAFGRLLRELNQYRITPARQDKPLLSTEFDVYIWRAAIRQFRRIGVRSSYYSADGLIRQHIRRRWRRRSRVCWRYGSIFARCDECGSLRRRHYSGVCFACAVDLASEYSPDDYPALDADQLFR